jgi:large subunit ribosomal protein L23
MSVLIPTLVPRISEKAIGLAEKGVYVFEVPTSTNKIEVARAVEAAFKVNVTAVNMMIIKGKRVTKRYGKNPGKRNDLKKAVVTVKSGQKIALFEEGGK